MNLYRSVFFRVATLFLFAPFAFPQAPQPILSDPQSPELLALAQPVEVDESDFGAGALRAPGTTYYVAPNGDDEADGLSWDTAWRTLERATTAEEGHQLRPGDTVVLGEGEYFVSGLSIRLQGEPGRPITIMGAPHARAALVGGVRVEGLTKTPGLRYTYEAEVEMSNDADWRGRPTPVWEGDSLLMLQDARTPERVDELPGTYCYDEEAGKIYVRFTDSRGPDVRSLVVRAGEPGRRRWTEPEGIEVQGAYLRFANLRFKHYHVAVHVHNAEHVTFAGCHFYATAMTGLRLGREATRCLLKENFGFRTGERGTSVVTDWRAKGNLYLRNRLDNSDPGIRGGAGSLHYAINNYDHAARNRVSELYLIDNVLTAPLGFRSKFTVLTGLVQGNVMLGRFHSERWPYRETEETRGPDDRLVTRNNVLLGNVSTAGHDQGPGGAGGEWAGVATAFLNNFAPPRGERAEAVAEARFADPAWHDYRLQSDSPLRGAGLGGADRGAFYGGRGGRVLYVGPEGDDEAPGTSERLAFRTLRRAARELAPGDTLYLMQGVAEPLVVEASGTLSEPIHVRAYKREEFALPGVSVIGSHVVIEGLVSAESPGGDGFFIAGDEVTLRECTALDNQGAGIRAEGVNGLDVQRCTVAHNTVGIAVDERSSGVRLRDNVLAHNGRRQLDLPPALPGGWVAGGNCYWGPGVDAERVSAESGSVVADPLFLDPDERDYRLRWDSPAAFLGDYGLPAGAYAAVPRDPAVADVAIVGLHLDAAAVSWATPLDDTTGRAAYRPVGEGRWRYASSPDQGTVHMAALTDLQPGTEYEVRVHARCVRDAAAASDVATFQTPAEARPPAVWHLSPQGRDSADGLTPETAWRTLARANAEVAPGDVVMLAPGRYAAPLAPMRPGLPEARIVFRAQEPGTAVVDGGGFVAPLARLTDRGHVTLDGLVFVGPPPRGAQPAVVDIRSRAHGVEVLNCRLGLERSLGTLGNGIFIQNSDDVRVERTVIWGTRYQVRVDNSEDAVLRNNTFVQDSGGVFSTHIRRQHDGLRMVNNIWHCPSGRHNPNVAIYMPAGQDALALHSDHNLFLLESRNRKVARVYSSYRQVVIEGETLELWQENTGLDSNSLHADPMFVDVAAGDFRLRPESPVAGAGEGGADIGALPVAR